MRLVVEICIWFLMKNDKKGKRKKKGKGEGIPFVLA